MNQRIKASLAELIGTFTLCFLGAGSIIIDAHTGGGVGLLGIAAAHGLGLAIAVTATMNISGGQINPAVTIGLLVIKKIKPGDAVFYIVAQLIGASLAGLVLLLFPGEASDQVAHGTPKLAEGIDVGTGIVLEIVATFLLAMAVYGTAVGSKAPAGIGGFAIGLMVAADILAIGPLTGAAMNPARHFGTALFGGELAGSAVYWIGPILGAVLGFLLFRSILEPNEDKDGS